MLTQSVCVGGGGKCPRCVTLWFFCANCRDAGAKFAEILGAAGFGSSGVPGMLHCFTGNGEELRQCLELGLHIGITGWVGMLLAGTIFRR